MNYKPREYWPERLQKQGQCYVAPGNNEEMFVQQADKFWSYLQPKLSEHSGEILDFGCGVGRFAERITTLGYDYVGADITQDALSFAPQLERTRYVYLSEDYLPFEDNAFDAVLLITVLQHVVDDSDYKLWSKELARVLRSGGVFFIIDDNNRADKMAAHMCIRTPEVIADSLGANILDVEIVDGEYPESHWQMLAKKR